MTKAVTKAAMTVTSATTTAVSHQLNSKNDEIVKNFRRGAFGAPPPVLKKTKSSSTKKTKSGDMQPSPSDPPALTKKWIQVDLKTMISKLNHSTKKTKIVKNRFKALKLPKRKDCRNCSVNWPCDNHRKTTTSPRQFRRLQGDLKHRSKSKLNKEWKPTP